MIQIHVRLICDNLPKADIQELPERAHHKSWSRFRRRNAAPMEDYCPACSQVLAERKESRQ